MATARVMAAVLLLVVAGSCVADAARTTSAMTHHRELLSGPWATSWGSHHPGEVCYTDNLVTSLLKPVLRQIKVYLSANLEILCIDVLYADVFGLSPLLALVNVPLHSTGHCSSLVSVHTTLTLDVNVSGLLGAVLSALERVVAVRGIVGNNGLGVLLYLEIELSSGRKLRCGQSTALGLSVELEIGLLQSLLGVPAKYCTYNGVIAYVELLVG